MAPIPLLITFIFMPSMSSFSNEFFTASSLPLTSAFNIIFISFSPASFLLNRSANEACVFGLFFFSFSILMHVMLSVIMERRIYFTQFYLRTLDIFLSMKDRLIEIYGGMKNW